MFVILSVVVSFMYLFILDDQANEIAGRKVLHYLKAL